MLNLSEAKTKTTHNVGCIKHLNASLDIRVPELCESPGCCPGLSVLMSLMVSVDIKQH